MKWNSIKSPKKSRERILEKKDGYGKKKLQIISSILDKRDLVDSGMHFIINKKYYF